MNHSQNNEKKDYFVQQIAYIEENMKDLTALYISSTPVQEQFKHFFNVYILELEELISQNEVIPTISKVFIGTKVTVSYDDEDDTEEYVICFPEHSDPDHGYISFLSPVGRQLLLKKIGESISLKIPTGQLQVNIQKIDFVSTSFDIERQTKEA
ncbi:GreA/GreB family elongation factor [Bacillus rubiinfantis]|uniref:GreA/GreB family elongation factor n=1 Tax=Bacillus rubiinfantis TaxID=1499680 RepID=UPI0005AAA1E1|nr:GreA/GreB family elongation factor [Bacillus rubiinfantis]